MSTAPPPDAVAETTAPMETSSTVRSAEVTQPAPAATKSDPPPFDGLRIYRMTIDQYHRMIEAGVLTGEDRVELLNGYLSEKMPQNPPHSSSVAYWDETIRDGRPGGTTIRCQLPITLDSSEPEPDLAIARGTALDYAERHPSGEDCFAVVEVADTTLAIDRRKALIYAAAGIPEYLIIDLGRRRWEHHRQPEGGEYASIRRGDAAGTFELPVGDGSVSFDFDAVFGPPAA